MTQDRLKALIAQLEDAASTAGHMAMAFTEGHGAGYRSQDEQDEEAEIGADLEHAQECIYNAIDGIEAAIIGIREANARKAHAQV